MTKCVTNQIIKSLAYDMPVEEIAVAMGVSLNDVYFVAETRKADIIEERAFCKLKED